MPAKRVGGQIRIPRDRFEEWIGTAITVWPPVTADTDTDDVTAIAVNETPSAVVSKSLHVAPSRHTSRSSSASDPRPAMLHPPALTAQPNRKQTGAREQLGVLTRVVGVLMLRVTTLYACTAAATAQYYTRYLTQADGEHPDSGPAARRSAGSVG